MHSLFYIFTIIIFTSNHSITLIIILRPPWCDSYQIVLRFPRLLLNTLCAFCLPSVFCDIAGSLAAGRWTAWPLRDRRTMALLCHWIPSFSRLLGSWEGGRVSVPSLTTLSGNTAPTSSSRQHWEVNECLFLLLLTFLDNWRTV